MELAKGSGELRRFFSCSFSTRLELYNRSEKESVECVGKVLPVCRDTVENMTDFQSIDPNFRRRFHRNFRVHSLQI